MNKKTDKETAVYEAVFRLLERGERLYSVTVQQIAEAAGIGKGTVYEYFSSREEILSKALLYRIRAEGAALALRVDAQCGFAAKLDTLLCFARDAVRSQASGMQALFASLQLMAPPQAVCRALQQSDVTERLSAMALAILEEGAREGLFPQPQDESYALMATLGAVMGYVNAGRVAPGQDDGALREKAVRMLCRALA